MTIILDGTTGITTPAINSSGDLELPGGTANGVLYLNGSKIATSGSALVFDGTNLGLGVTPSAWSTGKAIQLNNVQASIWGAGDQINVISNAYFDGAYKYAATKAASMYEQALGVHSWFTAGSDTAGNTITWTQAMTLTAAGNLLVSGGSTNTTFTSAGQFAIKRSNSQPFISFHGDGGARLGYLQMQDSDVATLSVDANQPLVFQTNATERARITSDGQLLLGTTSFTSGGIQKLIAIDGPSNCGITFNRSGAVTAYIYTYSAVGFRVETGVSYAGVEIVPGGTGGVSLSSGDTSWSSMSDERHKTDLKPIENACSKISSVRAVTGRYKTDPESSSRAFLIAQDVLAVLPEAVNASDEDKLSLRYTEVIPLLVAAIKELKAEIDQLKGN